MANFYERLSYSFGNEDWSTEQQALKITPKDSVVCVTASGDRPLNLLTSNCKELLSIDANPIQNYLLNLKCAAPDFKRLIKGIYKTAKPGARFCMRQFLSGQQIPEKFLPHFQRDMTLEDELQKQDNCFVYRFIYCARLDFAILGASERAPIQRIVTKKIFL